MKLQHLSNSSDDLCILCQMDVADPNREDGLCNVCAEVSDSYEESDQSLDLIGEEDI